MSFYLVLYWKNMYAYMFLLKVFIALKQKQKYTNSYQNDSNHREKISEYKQISLKTTCLGVLFHELHMKLANLFQICWFLVNF